MTPDLRLEQVHATLGNRDFHYDFALQGAGLVAITGPSGAGKSTLFHLIAGFEPPHSGRIFLNGEVGNDVPPGERPLTYVFQDYNLFAHLDVFTNVALGLSPRLRLSAADKASVALSLEKVGLAGFGDRMPRALSGGERQRVAFARALVRKRPFLLLDEPFASLDGPLRQSMGDLLQLLVAAGPTLALMITHDLQEVARLADRVIEISDGAVAFCGLRSDWQAWRMKPENLT
jgi:thiamine transport system ATP-binding protein